VPSGPEGVNGPVRAFLPVPAEPVSALALDEPLARDEPRVLVGLPVQDGQVPVGLPVQDELQVPVGPLELDGARVRGAQRVRAQDEARVPVGPLVLDGERVEHLAALRGPVAQPGLDGLPAQGAPQLEARVDCSQGLSAAPLAEPAQGGSRADEPFRADFHSVAADFAPLALAESGSASPHVPAEPSVHSAERILSAKAQASPRELCRVWPAGLRLQRLLAVHGSQMQTVHGSKPPAGHAESAQLPAECAVHAIPPLPQPLAAGQFRLCRRYN